MVVKILIVKPHRAHNNSNNDFSILIHEEEESKFFGECHICTTTLSNATSKGGNLCENPIVGLYVLVWQIGLL